MNKTRYFNRRIILIPLAVILTGLLQNVFAPFPLFPLIPCAVCVGFFSDEYGSLFAGILGGIIWDAVSSAPDGVYTLFLALTGLCSALLAKYLFRRKCGAALLVAGVVLLAFALVSALAGSADGGFSRLFFLRFLPCSAVSAAFVPLFFGILRKMYE